MIVSPLPDPLTDADLTRLRDAAFTGHCADCDATLTRWTEAEFWLDRDVLVDLDACDPPCTGQVCPVTGEPHRTAVAS